MEFPVEEEDRATPISLQQQEEKQLAFSLLSGLVIQKRKHTLAICAGPDNPNSDHLSYKKARKGLGTQSITNDPTVVLDISTHRVTYAKAEKAGQTMPPPNDLRKLELSWFSGCHDQ